MDRIDDPYDAAKAAHPAPPKRLATDLAMGAVAELFPLARFAKVVADHLSQKAMQERGEALCDALNDKIREALNLTEANSKTIGEIKMRAESLEFRVAASEAAIQAALSTEPEVPRRLGAALGGALVVEDWPTLSGDLRRHVRAIAQLDGEDVVALRLMVNLYRDVVVACRNIHDSNPFTHGAAELLRRAAEAGLDRDSFHSCCRRLEGFGLATEVPRNDSLMQQGDYCFRPTRRGIALLDLLPREDAASGS